MTYEKEIFNEIENKLKKSDFTKTTQKNTFDVDKIILHKIFGIIIFILIFTSTMVITFYIAQHIESIIELIIDKIKNIADKIITNTNIKFFINNCVLITAESILSCSAQIFSIYFFTYILKESGYLARGMFIIEKTMKAIGLNRDAFIPLVSNLACNVPGILSTKTIKDKNTRFITIIISPLISCTAKLPIYMLISGIYFSGIKRSLLVLSVYLLGVIIGAIISKIASSFIKKTDTTFITEIPSYQFPNLINIASLSSSKAINFIKNTAPLIFIFTLTSWVLNNIPTNNPENKKETYLHKISKNIEPVLSTLGFDYKMDISLLGGIFAKESVPVILKTLYNINDSDNKEDIKNKIPIQTGITFLIFTMIYCPCINTLITIKGELGSIITVFLMLFYIVLAFIVSFLFKIFINIFF